MEKRWKYFLLALVLIASTVWLAVLNFPEEKLHIIACDVGQGDAILAVYKDVQILVDGGPNSRVIECLDRHLPFWDRTIEAVVLTHPQEDHFRGLIEVFERFKVNTFVATPIDSSSQDYGLLKSVVGGSSTEVVSGISDNDLRLGLIYLDIVHPSEEYLLANSTTTSNVGSNLDNDILGSYSSSRDPNDFSVVVLLSLGEFDALLAGDIGPETSDMVANELLANVQQPIEYIKIPHHGSKNGISNKLLEVVDPEVAVISVGKDNRYGHPHKEVLDILKEKGIEILRTDEMGDVEVVTDGEKFWEVN